MNELIATAKVVLGNTFVMYFKAASYHWNVEGKNFTEMHDFFGDLYAEIYGAIDPLTEEIRALDAYAPISLMELYNYKTITEDSVKPTDCKAMLMNLGVANTQMIEALNKLFAVATATNNQGLADFAAGRLDTHAKHGWMLRSFIKGGE
jgi:starvation-inducible DNA-binding protein